MKILVVDDDSICRYLISQMLLKKGYEIHTADNGKTGMAKALEVKPDLILMDMNMPVMDGFEAVRALRRKGYTGKIAACTGYADHSVIREAGCNTIISKPFLLDEFLEFLKDSAREECS